jgi:hypothetical protein
VGDRWGRELAGCGPPVSPGCRAASTGGRPGSYLIRMLWPLGTVNASGACSSSRRFSACVRRPLSNGTSATRRTSSMLRWLAQASSSKSPRASSPSSGSPASGKACRNSASRASQVATSSSASISSRARGRSAAARALDASTGSTAALRSSRKRRSRYQHVVSPTTRCRGSSKTTERSRRRLPGKDSSSHSAHSELAIRTRASRAPRRRSSRGSSARKSSASRTTDSGLSRTPRPPTITPVASLGPRRRATRSG